jgi:hypothetical protein
MLCQSFVRTWLVVGCALVACAGRGAAISLRPVDYVINADALALPDALIDRRTMTVRAIPCHDDSSCLLLTDGLARCTDQVCVLEPVPVALGSAPIDLDTYPEAATYRDGVVAFDVSAATFAASANGLRVRLGPTELYWAPPSATSFAVAGVVRLGTIEPIDLAAAETAEGAVNIDPAGAAALSRHVATVAHRFVLFARPMIYVAPGEPVPTGSIRLQVRMEVHVEGQAMR